MLRVQFSEPINPDTFTEASVQVAGLDANDQPVALGAIAVAVSVQPDNMSGDISFSPALPDYARYIVAITGVTDTAGNALAADNERILTTLRGDVSGDLRVNATDLSAARGARTGLVNSVNIAEVRADVSLDGRVNATDLSRIRPHRGNDATGISEPVIAGP